MVPGGGGVNMKTLARRAIDRRRCFHRQGENRSTPETLYLRVHRRRVGGCGGGKGEQLLSAGHFMNRMS